MQTANIEIKAERIEAHVKLHEAMKEAIGEQRAGAVYAFGTALDIALQSSHPAGRGAYDAVGNAMTNLYMAMGIAAGMTPNEGNACIKALLGTTKKINALVSEWLDAMIGGGATPADLMTEAGLETLYPHINASLDITDELAILKDI